MLHTSIKDKTSKNSFKAIALLLLALIPAQALLAQGNAGPAKPSSMDNPMVLTMVIIMLILLLVIGLLANLVMGAAVYYRQQQKEREQEEKKNAAHPGVVASVMAGLLLLSAPLFAQDAKTVSETAGAAGSFGGLSATAFYLVITVIFLELLVIFGLLYQLRGFLAKEKAAKAEVAEVYQPGPQRWKLLWEKLNRFRPQGHEAQIDLGHDYDGIRELDNRLPPWWLYGFYITIIFGGVYLWQHHVSHTAPLSGEEFQIAMKEAEVQKAEYLKKAANKVDENTVKLLTDASALEGGKTIFEKNCIPCHGQNAQGVVGPNLTDDYWLHGGSIHDIFKTIKYGWPEKGMKSWKDDLSAGQIAQVASYIKSLHGTNPPGAKEKQGDLYRDTDDAAPGKSKDSSTTKVVASTNGH